MQRQLVAWPQKHHVQLGGRQARQHMLAELSAGHARDHGGRAEAGDVWPCARSSATGGTLHG